MAKARIFMQNEIQQGHHFVNTLKTDSVLHLCSLEFAERKLNLLWKKGGIRLVSFPVVRFPLKKILKTQINPFFRLLSMDNGFSALNKFREEHTEN